MVDLPNAFNNWPAKVQAAARDALIEGAPRVRGAASAEAVMESIWNVIVQVMEDEQE